MKMGNILSNQKTGERFASSAVSAVSRDSANDLYAVSFVFKEGGTSADTVYRNTVDKVGVSELLPRTDVAGEEAQCVCLDVGEAEPVHCQQLCHS